MALLKKPTAQEVLYSDFKSSFDIHPVTGDLVMITNEQAVSSALKNIMLTGRYEAFFNHMFGAGLQKYLFENVTPAMADIIKESIELAIENWEERAEAVEVDVYLPDDMNGYSVTIKFRVKTVASPVVIQHFLKRIR